jgi:hypothetical protein
MQVRQGRVYFTTLAELLEGAPLMTGTFSIKYQPVIILFDFGATHSSLQEILAFMTNQICHVKYAIGHKK